MTGWRRHVPKNWRAAGTKPEIALAEIDHIRAAGVRLATVLADAGYGLFAPFHQGLEGRGLKRAVGIPKLQKVYPSNVRTRLSDRRTRAAAQAPYSQSAIRAG